MMTLDDLVELSQILGGEDDYFELHLNEKKRKEFHNLFEEGDGVDFMHSDTPKTIEQKFLNEKYDLYKFLGYHIYVTPKLK